MNKEDAQMRHLILSSLFLAASVLDAQTWTPRVNYGARLEPSDVIVHGAGQDTTDFNAYWNIMPIGLQPQVYMYYIGLDTLDLSWADYLKWQLQAYPASFLIPQIGLNMTNGVNAHYEADVAAGKYDTQIGYLVAGLRKLATPAYLRIGYEFNGLSWNGYLPGPYAQAFIRIASALRAATDIEVATVWDAEVDGVTNYMDYYPGDQYVDWFGMNIFNAASFGNSNLPAFMALADAHKKPVMIGETTPMAIGAQQGATSWNTWFAPFFSYLQATPEVKEFNYIDCDWSTTPLSNWGDSRLQMSSAAYVRDRYIAELSDPMVFSGATESEFRRLLGYTSSAAPPAVTDLSVRAANGTVVLTRTAVTDANGIARYYIYRNNALLDYALGPPYSDPSPVLGTSTYSIVAMDRAGNQSIPSKGQSATLTEAQLIQNGGFEDGLSEWQFVSFATGATGTAVIDTTNPIDGTASVKINVTGTTGIDWNLQLRQVFQMTQGLTYTISFKACASAAVTLPMVIQEFGSPGTVYFGQAFTAGTSAATFTYSYTAPTSHAVFFAFYLDNIGSTTLWLDDVSVIESSSSSSVPPDLMATGVMSSASYLPAIAPGGLVTLMGATLSPVKSDTWDNSIVNGKLPASLDGVTVTIGGEPAYINYLSPGQINALAPQTDHELGMKAGDVNRAAAIAPKK